MTKIDLTPIEDTIRHLREENERLRLQRDNATHMWEATSENVRELKEELAKVREANAQQAETIRRYQQDARTRIARSGE